jgi:hypothetical protein
MTTDVGPSRARSGEVTAPRHTIRRFARRGAYQDTKTLAVLSLLPALIVAAVVVSPANMPITSLMVPLLLGSLLLTPRHLPWFVIYVLAALMISLALQETVSAKTYGAVAIQVLMCLIVLGFSLRRSRLGVAGAMGESMFVDLRDRILQQGGVPDLPLGWHAESALRSAGGTPFAGDFVVATRVDARRLELAVVDVSGKGEEAGTRALLLSGAFGGLLGALPADRFLPAANDYLLRQDWEEGFATAIHLSLDLGDGTFEVRSAGHPPAALRQAGPGRWAVLPSEGPVLGLMPEAVFVSAAGRLGDGDALLLYTDGMVEEPRRDIELGIDRMLGEAEHLLRGTFHGAAQRLVDALGSRDDDRAMVVVSRSQGTSR